jgi:hypothetical protein
MPITTIRFTSTHHVRVRFDCSIDTIWGDIDLGLGRGRRFEHRGYRVRQIVDDPRAYITGYQMWREDSDDLERLVFITERDLAAKRLSLCAYYLGAKARDTVVQATYSAVQDEQGSWYQVDCHGTRYLEVDAGISRDEIVKAITNSNEDMDRYLRSALEAQKSDLEGLE